MSETAIKMAMAPCASHPSHEHEFKDLGMAELFIGAGVLVWWWACDCGLFVWHQRGSLERGIKARHFETRERAPKWFCQEP